MELEIATRNIFGTEEHPLPGPASQHLQKILRGINNGTFDNRGVARPYTKEEFAKVYPHWRDPTKKLTVAQEEELASRKAKELHRKSIVEACGTFACAAWGAVEEESTSNERGWGSNNGWGTSNTGGWGNIGGTWAHADGGWAPHVAGRQAVGVPQAEAGALPKRNKGGEKKKQSLLLFPSVVPRASLHLRYLPSGVQPHCDPWDTIDWGNEPSTPCHTVYGPDPEPREPTFVLGKIPKTNIPLSVILDREFLVLMLTTMNEEEGEEAPAEPAPASEEDPKAMRARYMRTSGLRANDDLWHQRLGHPSCVTLKKCIEAGVFAPGTLLCPDGSETLKPTRVAKLQKVYSDFLVVGYCGTNDEQYTPTFVDAGTRYVWIVNVKARSRAYGVFRLWLAHPQRQSGKKLKIWQSDGVVQFCSKEMQDYLAQKGIEHHVSLPYAHQKQGVIERTNHTLMTKVRALLKQSKLPLTYWTYAMHHAVRVHNLLSTTAITGNLLLHLKWTGTKGDKSMLRVWGCMVQYGLPTSTLGNFASRARWGIYLGITHEYKAWIILDLLSQKTMNARDVIFYERLNLAQFREDEQTNANRVYAHDGHNYATPEDEAAAAFLEQDTGGEFTGGDRHSSDDDDEDPSRGGVSGSGGSSRGVAPPPPPEPESDDDDMHEVIPQHRHNSTVLGLQLLGLHTATSTAPRVIKPKNPRQALTGPHSKEWRQAMDAEIKVLESRDTWVLINRAAIKGRRILFGKWVFRVKTAADGTIERFKARWVVCGYDQRHGIDFNQTFPPASRHTSVRILLSIAAARHLQLRQIDVKNAFLYALVDAVIYVEQPHTYGEGDSCVCQLQKSLYGIKQAPRLWQRYLHNILLKIGFKKVPRNPGMYHHDFRGEYILLTVYVGDLLYTGSSNVLLERFEKNLAGRVDIICNHDLKQFLCLNISYPPDAIHLLAAKYAEELGKRFNITPSPLSTPYRTPGPNHKPDNKSLSPAGLQTYQQQLGCLLFTSVTCRPDLSYIASQLAQYSCKPTAENILDLQRALQFFISTPNVGLCYSTVATSSFNLIGHVDADHAADPDN
ncbi:unnamed protein product [Closterium sp. NIES-54]